MRSTGRAAVVAVLAFTACGAETAGPTHQASESADPRVVIEVARDEAPAGTFVDVVVRLENVRPEGSATVTFGDGGPGTGWAATAGGCGTEPGRRDERTLRHAYRRAGTWTVTATFGAAACGDEPGRTYESTAVVRVTEAAVGTNGPLQPVVSAVAPVLPDRAKGTVTVRAKPRDGDGYLTELRYDWGDGSADSVFTFPLSRCVDPRDTWPFTEAPGDGVPWASQDHTYAEPGPHTVSVTAVTTGCDGGSPQRATEKVAVVT